MVNRQWWTAKCGRLVPAKTWLRWLVSRGANGSCTGGLLLHGTADLPHGLGIDESTMYGDYYYLKSLLSLPGLSA